MKYQYQGSKHKFTKKLGRDSYKSKKQSADICAASKWMVISHPEAFLYERNKYICFV